MLIKHSFNHMKFILCLINIIKLYKLMISLNHAILIKYYKKKLVKLSCNIKLSLIIVKKYDHKN
jgi:hypothetical protein